MGMSDIRVASPLRQTHAMRRTTPLDAWDHSNRSRSSPLLAGVVIALLPLLGGCNPESEPTGTDTTPDDADATTTADEPSITPVTVDAYTWTGELPPGDNRSPVRLDPLTETYINAIPPAMARTIHVNDAGTFRSFVTHYKDDLLAIMRERDPVAAFAAHFEEHQDGLGVHARRLPESKRIVLHAMNLVHGALRYGEPSVSSPGDSPPASIRELLARPKHDDFAYATVLHDLLRMLDVPSRIRVCRWSNAPVGCDSARPLVTLHHEHTIVWADDMVLDPLSNIAATLGPTYRLDDLPIGERMATLLERGDVHRGYCWHVMRSNRIDAVEAGVDPALQRWLFAYAIEGMDREHAIIQSHISPIEYRDEVRLLSTDAGAPSTTMRLDVDRSWFMRLADGEVVLQAWDEQLDHVLDMAEAAGTRAEIIAAIWPVFESGAAYIRAHDAVRGPMNEDDLEDLHERFLDAAENVLSFAESEHGVQGWSVGRSIDPMQRGDANPADTRYTAPTHRMLSSLYAMCDAVQSDGRTSKKHLRRAAEVRREVDSILDNWSAAYHEATTDAGVEGWFAHTGEPDDRTPVLHATAGMGSAWLLRSSWTGDIMHLERVQALARSVDAHLRLDEFTDGPLLIWPHDLRVAPLVERSSGMTDVVRFMSALHHHGWLRTDEVQPPLAAMLRHLPADGTFAYAEAIDGPPASRTVTSTMPATAIAEALVMMDDPALRAHLTTVLDTLDARLTRDDDTTLDMRLCALRLWSQLTRIPAR